MEEIFEALNEGLAAMGGGPEDNEKRRKMILDALNEAKATSVVDLAERRKLKDQKTDMHFRNKERF